MTQVHPLYGPERRRYSVHLQSMDYGVPVLRMQLSPIPVLLTWKSPELKKKCVLS